MRRERRAIQQKKKLTRRHGDTEGGASAAGQLKSEELREKSEKCRNFRFLPMFGKTGPNLPNIGKSIRRAIFKFCQPLAKSKEICQTLAKLSDPHTRRAMKVSHGGTEPQSAAQSAAGQLKSEELKEKSEKRGGKRGKDLTRRRGGAESFWDRIYRMDRIPEERGTKEGRARRKKCGHNAAPFQDSAITEPFGEIHFTTQTFVSSSREKA